MNRVDQRCQNKKHVRPRWWPGYPRSILICMRATRSFQAFHFNWRYSHLSNRCCFDSLGFQEGGNLFFRPSRENFPRRGRGKRLFPTNFRFRFVQTFRKKYEQYEIRTRSFPLSEGKLFSKVENTRRDPSFAFTSLCHGLCIFLSGNCSLWSSHLLNFMRIIFQLIKFRRID